ncbi:T9SS type A sorting domain-containing protein [Hymenobacter elongatus]|uniref:T9SS type A sorting domain-containing protein n=1 Tax=Hymenobacter elongatus TaxID=877208 RepID=A0A4Z0PNS7_9BACT|nr:T9SS type A sorting domain-containing protein [Hymenobacter elongatus]TGE17839.1 T9SS type A sorting domain-containing protein [Hymenobacter elongatus]
MKHCYLLLVLLLLGAARPSYAQRPLAAAAAAPGNPPPSLPATLNHFTATIDSLTQHLSRTPIASGILYDRVMPLAGLHAFNAGASLDTSSAAHFRQAYLELYTAAYNPSNRPRPAYLRARADYLARRDSVPLAVFDAAFHQLDTLARADNLLTEQNGLLYDVAGRPRSPFVARALVLAAALTDTIAPTTRFYFGPELALSTRGRTVSSLLIDFDNQQAPVQCLPGQAVPVSYGTPGAKVLRFTVFFADGTQAPALARLYVRDGVLSRASLPLTSNFEEVIATKGFTDYTFTSNGSFSTPVKLSLYGMGQTLTVLHHPLSQAQELAATGSYQLRNPIIFIDGFDANDGRQLYYNTPESHSIYNDLREQGILDLFDRQERDLIILNFPKSRRPKVGGGWTDFDVDGGTDYIERNALVLVQLLNDLKPRLAGPADKFTIIGPSMAGLISRYALARMEQEQLAATTPADQAYWDHRTALWVSLDSPHQGANIPLADQEFLRYYQGLSDVAEQTLNESINSPASRQMLVHHYLAGSELPAGAPGFRNQFMLALRDNGLSNSFGYPVNLRRVALANGRLDGIQRPDITPCGTALQLDIFLRHRAQKRRRRTYFLWINTTNSFSSATLNFTPGQNTRCQVFEGKISPLVLGGTGYSGQSIPLRRRTFVFNGSAGSYDLAPGGSYNTQEQIRQKTEAADDLAPFDAVFDNVVAEHCFIPTVSALAYQYQTLSSYRTTQSLPRPYANMLGRDLSCSGETPFDAYYGPAHTNTYHVEPDGEGLAFLAQELSMVTKATAMSSTITALCPGGSAQISIPTECSRLAASGQPLFPVTYSWTTADPGLRVVSGQGTATPTVQAQPGFVGFTSVFVTATRAGFQPSAPTRYSVYVGGGYTSAVGPYVPVCSSSQVVFTAGGGNIDGNYSWNVYLNDQLRNSLIVRNDNATLTVQPDQAGTLRVEATAEDLCAGGQTTPSPAYVTVVSQIDGFPCNTIGPSLQLYPNPASEQVEITVTEPDGTARRGGPAFQVTLYNGQGRPLRQAEASAGRVLLSTATLPAGLYQVQVRLGSQVLRRQLSVQH